MSTRLAAAAVCLVFARGAVAAEGRALEVASWLTGTFENEGPAAAGATPEAVRIVIVAVPKSRIANGAPVVYREQAAAPKHDEPSEQRFYRLEEEGDAVRMRAFDPKDPFIVRGKWRDPSVLALYGANDMRERPGCSVLLRKSGDRWEGGTKGTACPSIRRPAATMTSALMLSKDGFVQWDRGFDEKGRQVWGSTEAGTPFVKRSAAAPADDAFMERPVGRRAEGKTKEGISAKSKEGTGDSAMPAAGEAKPGGGFSANGKEVDGAGAATKGAVVATAPVTEGAINLLGPYSPSKKYGLTELRALATSGRLPVLRLFPVNEVSAASVVVVTSRSGSVTVFSSAEISSSSSDAPSLDVSSSVPRLVAAGGRGLDDVVSIELRVLAPAK